jgi:hypothetical protein
MNDFILNPNSRDGVQALRKARGLCPAQTLRCGSAQLGRVLRKQRQLDSVPATLDIKEDVVYLFTSHFATEVFHTKWLD